MFLRAQRGDARSRYSRICGHLAASDLNMHDTKNLPAPTISELFSIENDATRLLTYNFIGALWINR